MQPQARVEITTADDGTHTARINDTGPFPVEAFGVESDENGRTLVSLVLPIASLRIGDDTPPPAGPPSTVEHQLKTWGDPSTPDPRESLPGWSRPLSESVASKAQDSAEHQGLGEGLAMVLNHQIRTENLIRAMMGPDRARRAKRKKRLDGNTIATRLHTMGLLPDHRGRPDPAPDVRVVFDPASLGDAAIESIRQSLKINKRFGDDGLAGALA